MKNLIRISLYMFVVIAFLASACSEEGGQNSTDVSTGETETALETPGEAPRPSAKKYDTSKNKVTSQVEQLVVAGGNFNDGKEVIATYGISNTDDWEQVRTVMWEYHYSVAGTNPDAKSITLMGYPTGKIPNINDNKDAAFNGDQLCMIDNTQGYWRWSWGDLDAEGNFKESKKIE